MNISIKMSLIYLGLCTITRVYGIIDDRVLEAMHRYK